MSNAKPNTNSLVISNSQLEHKRYKAIYAVEFFPRKKVASYALWAVSIRDGHHYPKIPTGYGKTDTLEQAHLALTAYCEANGLGWADIRQEIIPWRLVKDLMEGKSGAEFAARQVLRRGGDALTASLKMANEIVSIINDTPMTNSLIVAEKFHKRHDHVLRAIADLKIPGKKSEVDEVSLPKIGARELFCRLNFKPSEYLDERGKLQPMVQMTWKGFSMLGFGFTGDKAFVWKQYFLDAFEAMGEEIYRRKTQQQEPFWQQQRLEGKKMRLELTDGIQEFIGYAKAQGSQNSEQYYRAITKMEYRALFMVEKAVGEGFRDTLTAFQNMNLATAEGIAQKALADGMESKLYYKDIFKLAKERVQRLAEMLGQSLPGAERTLRLVSSQNAKKQLSL